MRRLNESSSERPGISIRVRATGRKPRRNGFPFPYEKIRNNLRKWKTVRWDSSDLRIRARRAPVRRFRQRRNPEAVRSAICAACTNTKSNCRLERTTAEMTAKSKSPFVMRCIVFSVFASIIEEWFTSIAFWICLWFCLPHYCGVICKYCLLC